MGIGINPDYEKDGENRLWKNLTIPYKIGDDFAVKHKQRILDMINEWNDSRMVIKYKPYNEEDDFLIFEKITTGGGSSPVGRKVKNGQSLKIDLDAKKNDSILHEMAHAAGLHHEHQRSDRNSYIQMDHKLFNRNYADGYIDNSNVDWDELLKQYNDKYNTDLNDADDHKAIKEIIARYGIIPECNKKYKIYTCYDYHSITHYKTQEKKEIWCTRYDTIHSHPEVFGGYNYVNHSQFSSNRNDQTARSGLSFNDIYTIWRIYAADCPLPPYYCTYGKSRISNFISLHGSTTVASEF